MLTVKHASCNPACIKKTAVHANKIKDKTKYIKYIVLKIFSKKMVYEFFVLIPISYLSSEEHHEGEEQNNH